MNETTSATMTDTIDNQTAMPDPNDSLAFDKMILGRIRNLRQAAEITGRGRLKNLVTLIKRYRGDHFGSFSTRTDELQWLEVPSRGLQSWPVVPRAVRSNSANWLNAKIQLTVEPNTSDAEKEAGVNVAQSIYDYCHEKDWTEVFEERMSEIAQLQGTYGIQTYIDTKSYKLGTVKVPKTSEVETQTGLQRYVCKNCGIEAPPIEGMTQSVDCPSPDCGGQMLLLGERQNKTVTVPSYEYDEIPIPEIKTDLLTAMEMVVDERHAHGGIIEDAHWFCRRKLMCVYEIEEMFPHSKGKITGGYVSKWSDATRWLHAFETNAHNPVGYYNTPSESKSSVDELAEVEFWYFKPVACGGWKSPGNYSLTHQEKIIFDFQQGETISDSAIRNSTQKGAKKPKFEGLLVVICNDILLWIDNKCFEKYTTAGGWQMNATSFWHKGQEDLIPFHDAMTTQLTLFYEYMLRQSLPHTILDGRMFNHRDFRNKAGGISYTQQGLERDKPIDHYIMQLSPPQLGATPFNIFNLYMEGQKEASGIYESTVGAVDPNNKTATGQQISLNRSLGLMTGSQKSKKRAKIQWGYSVIELWQKYMPDEAYRALKPKYGEEWRTQDIAAFRKLDIRRDLTVKAVEGTDIPVSLPEKQQKYVTALSLGLFDPANPTPIAIKAIMLKMLGIDYDFENFEAHKRTASNRLKFIKQYCAEAVQMGIAYIINPTTGESAPNDEIISLILSQPVTQMLKLQDEHLVHIEFYNDQIMALACEPNPDQFLLTVLQRRVEEHWLNETGNQGDLEAAKGLISATGQAANELGKQALLPPAPADTTQEDQAAMDAETQANEQSANLEHQANEREREREFEAQEKANDRRHEKEMSESKQMATTH